MVKLLMVAVGLIKNILLIFFPLKHYFGRLFLLIIDMTETEYVFAW